MHDPRQTSEFLFRRLTEPPEVLGSPLDFSPMWWLAIAMPLLLLALAGVYRLYRRDRQSVGAGWSMLLSGLRTLTYLSLFFVWLLPAVREVEMSEQRSRVILVFDVSASMQGSDEPAAETPGTPRKTRAELVREWIELGAGPSDSPTQSAGFLDRLLRKNPLVCYRFGQGLDPQSWAVSEQERPSELGWIRLLEPSRAPPLSEPVPAELVDVLVQSGKQLRQAETSLQGPARDRRQREIVDNLERSLTERSQVRERLLERTNLGGALLDVLRKESGNMVQGMVVFSDGRNNAGSSQELAEVVGLARKAKVPVFTIGVGRHREVLNLRLVALLAPGRVQPEDEFPVRVAVEGENAPRQQEVTVVLTIEKPGQVKQEMRQTVTLQESTARLSSAAAEFRVSNPDKLKGEWRFRARVEPLKGERLRGDNASEDAAVVKVEDRKLSVLVMASAAHKDYQFLRSLLLREQDKFDLTLYLQNAREGTVQDIDPKRLLERFPTELRDRDGDPYNLGNYDVLVAYDADWRALPFPVQENLRKWVEQLAGGMVVVAGPVHTFNLARDKDLSLIRLLYPVVLDDTVASFVFLDRPSRFPWALNWGPAASQLAYLDLTDSGDKAKTLEGWEEFFDVPRNPNTGLADVPAKRGFFTVFPLKDVKPAATIVARFSDPAKEYLMNPAGPRPGERQPYFVTHTVGKGPVFYIGSAESYRLREFGEKFHERFWTKLLRHVGKGDQGRGTRRGLLVVGAKYSEGDTVEAEAQLYDAEMKPFVADAKTRILLQVTPPEGTTDAPKEWSDGLEMKPAAGRPGWFQVRFPVLRAGRYGVDLRIPGSIEKLSDAFRVERRDPELDQTRPDYALLHGLATEAGDVTLLDERQHPEKRTQFLAALARSREQVLAQLKEAPAGALTPLSDAQKDRLFFDLESAVWVPECIDSNTVLFRTEGKIQDLWDKGWTVFADLTHPEQAAGPPWALVLIVGLLSLEWLIRKLIRLA